MGEHAKNLFLKKEIPLAHKDRMSCFYFGKNTSSFIIITKDNVFDLYLYNNFNQWKLLCSFSLKCPGYCFDFCYEDRIFYIGSNKGRYIKVELNLICETLEEIENKRVHKRFSRIVDIRILEKRGLIVTLGSDKMLICKTIHDNVHIFKEKIDLMYSYGFQVSDLENMIMVASKNLITFIKMEFNETGVPIRSIYNEKYISTIRMHPTSDIFAVGHDNGIIRLFYIDNLDNFGVYSLNGKKKKILRIEFSQEEYLIALSDNSYITIWDISKTRLPISRAAYAKINISPPPTCWLTKLLYISKNKKKNFCHICGKNIRYAEKFEFDEYTFYGFEEKVLICTICSEKNPVMNFRRTMMVKVDNKPKNFVFDSASKQIIFDYNSSLIRIYEYIHEITE